MVSDITRKKEGNGLYALRNVVNFSVTYRFTQ